MHLLTLHGHAYTRSAPALQPHKSSAEVKLNPDATWIEQMLPFFFVHLLLQIFAIGISAPLLLAINGH